MNDVREKGKRQALMQMRKMAMDSMKDGLGGMMGAKDGAPLKKVTVASNDQQGLEHGLDKAKQLIHGQDMSSDASSDTDTDDSDEDQGDNGAAAMSGGGEGDADEAHAEAELEQIADGMSSDELDKMINMLNKKKAMKQAQSGSDDASEEADMSDVAQ